MRIVQDPSSQINTRASSPGGYCMCPPFWTIGWEKCKLFSKEHFKDIAWPFLYYYYFCLLYDSHWMRLKLCVGQSARAWLLTSLIILLFCLLSNVLSIALHVKLNLSHLLVLGVSHYICSHLSNLMGIHLLCCVHGGERMALHDVVPNVIMAIAKDAKFHVSWRQTHILSPLP